MLCVLNHNYNSHIYIYTCIYISETKYKLINVPVDDLLSHFFYLYTIDFYIYVVVLNISNLFHFFILPT